ncbi:MAG: type II toxin-antitoxin system PemK/MazF family toxin [Lachnospiraceae bacterium]|nr:type II toxin-antitoxin system PemK/MazF family toxin [Lachnospiraceae bacterium]
MKSRDIQTGGIYFVNFEPTEPGEFDRKHLAVVIKKNHDRITFVVLPMTSKDKGVGVNKIPLGKLDCLPPNLQINESFAVIDQIRTLSSNRFFQIKDGQNVVNAVMPKEKMHILYKAIIKDLLHDVPDKELREILL